LSLFKDSNRTLCLGQLRNSPQWTLCGVVCRLIIIKLCPVNTQLTQVTGLMATTEPISRRYWLDQIFVMPLLNKAEAFLGIIFYGFVNTAGDYKGVMTPSNRAA
jgi:hypothetical protein